MMPIDDALARAERLENERIRAAFAHDACVARLWKWLRFWKWLDASARRAQYLAIGASIYNAWWLALLLALVLLEFWLVLPVSRWESLVSDAEKRGERMRR